MTQPKPAVIQGRYIALYGDTGPGHALHKAAGRFTVHKSFDRDGRWTVTLPSGIALGVGYFTRDSAKAAAAVMAPLVQDWHGDTLEVVFGSDQAGRDAYVAAVRAASN